MYIYMYMYTSTCASHLHVLGPTLCKCWCTCTYVCFIVGFNVAIWMTGLNKNLNAWQKREGDGEPSLLNKKRGPEMRVPVSGDYITKQSQKILCAVSLSLPQPPPPPPLLSLSLSLFLSLPPLSFLCSLTHNVHTCKSLSHSLSHPLSLSCSFANFLSLLPSFSLPATPKRRDFVESETKKPSGVDSTDSAQRPPQSQQAAAASSSQASSERDRKGSFKSKLTSKLSGFLSRPKEEAGREEKPTPIPG